MFFRFGNGHLVRPRGGACCIDDIRSPEAQPPGMERREERRNGTATGTSRLPVQLPHSSCVRTAELLARRLRETRRVFAAACLAARLGRKPLT